MSAESGTPADVSAATPPADPALSIPARRLAGSDHCLNCGVDLKGPYCHHCGQPDRRFQRVLPVLLRDLLADLIDLDARFFRTLTPLLAKPGHVTRDYLEGRRSRYTPPLRLYLFSSLVFFLLAALLGSDLVRIQTGGDAESGVRIDRVRIDLGGDEPGRAGTDAVGDRAASPRAASTDAAAQAAPTEPEAFDIQFNDAPWDPATNPVVLSFLPDSVNAWINEELEGSNRKARSIGENPRLLSDKMHDLLPGTMFLLLPVAALLLQFWYLFSKRYYIEHLIFALHGHSLAFVALSLARVMGAIGDAGAAHGPIWVAVLFGLLRVVMLAWLPVYLLLALKQVYRQGWTSTLIKFVAIGACYLLLLGVVTAGVSLASFLLL